MRRNNAPAVCRRGLFILLFSSFVVPSTSWPQAGHGNFDAPEKKLTELDARYQALENQDNQAGMAQVALEKAEALLALRRYDEAMEIYRANLDFCEKNRLPAEAVQTSDALAEMCRMRGAYPESLALFQKSRGLYRANGDRLGESGSIGKIGAVFLQLGQLDSAKNYLTRSLALKEQLGDSVSLNQPLNFLSLFYQRIGDWDKSLYYQLRAVALKKSQGDSTALPGLLNGVSSIFMAQNNWDKAEEYALQSLQLSEKQKLRFYKSGALIILANISLQRGDEAKAVEYHEQSIAILRGSKSGDLPNELLDLAKIYIRQGNTARAEPLITEAQQLAQRSQDQTLLAKTGILWGEFYLQKNDARAADRRLREALAKAEKGGYKSEAAEAFRLLSTVQERFGKPAEALVFFKKYAALRDSLLDEARQKTTRELETKYQLGEKETAIHLLNTQNEVQALRLREARDRQLGLLAGLAVLILLAGFGLYLFRLKQASNRRLSEKNALISKALQEKELLLREIHHRVKNNLQVISSLLKLQSAHLSDDKALRAINEGRNRVQSMALIHQNLYQDDNLTAISAADYIGKLTATLFRSYNIRPGSIELSTDIDPLLLDVDTAVPLGLILNELISNALKHAFTNSEHGSLQVVLKNPAENLLLLQVRDDGVGLNPDIFADNPPKQSFGIQLVKMLAEKLDATLQVFSENGTTVELRIRQFKLA